MTKIPIKTRLPIEAWTVAAVVTLFSLLSSVAHMTASNATTPSVEHAKLDSSPLITSAIR